MKKLLKNILILLLSLAFTVALCSCEISGGSSDIASIRITNGEELELFVGDSLSLKTDAPEKMRPRLEWSVIGDSVKVDSTGFAFAVSEGKATVTVSYGDISDTVIIKVVSKEDAPQDPPSYEEPPREDGDEDGRGDGDTGDLPLIDTEARDAFYGDSVPAGSYEEALQRSSLGIISGALTLPDQAPTVCEYRPVKDGAFIRNNQPYYADENTYVVVNAYGLEVFRVYRGGGYITLEEVAAYVYAFGDVPANYVSSKDTDPDSSIWGEYLRLNHSKFSGSTKKYPYEPKLPDISGCGGDLTYYEIDIGTTGTDCDPDYPIREYNNGYDIVRGAARIVYARFDANWDKITSPDERYVFYTYNHYNDFREYLNYYGGWGEMFGNITGGGKLSSKYDYNPTPYVETIPAPLTNAMEEQMIIFIDTKRLLALITLDFA